MRVLGLEEEIVGAPTEDELEPEVCEIWRDNLPTWNVFRALRTQWDVVAAADGELVRTALKYDRIEVVLRNTNGMPRRHWPTIFADLQAMEEAALTVMSKALEQRRQKRNDEWEARKQK
jgi:hypothetical protein